MSLASRLRTGPPESMLAASSCMLQSIVRPKEPDVVVAAEHAGLVKEEGCCS